MGAAVLGAVATSSSGKMLVEWLCIVNEERVFLECRTDGTLLGGVKN